jgi:2-polyprenyl-3-methyl-5-hydroxy-6-metoxy-1,4-benzoquinol methylase
MRKRCERWAGLRENKARQSDAESKLQGLTYTDAQSDNLNEDSRTPLLTLEEQRLHAAGASGGISSEGIYDRILQVIGDYDLRGCALDYGAGIGNFTRKLWASGRFEQIDGADILPRPENLPSTITWHRLDLNNANAIPAASFDVVIAAEVIEHLENPRQVAREWFQILKPGGTLVLSTPNNESIRSLMALLVRGHYVAFLDSCYPAHITALLRKDLERILSEAGFSDIRFHFTNHGGLPKLPAVSWQQVSLGLLKGCRFSDNVIAAAKVPVSGQ